MYGTVARLRLKPGKEAELERLSREQVPEIEGLRFQHVYNLDRDPQDFYMVIAFDSEEAYRRNAESPEQHARFERMMELMEAEPRWHDGEVMYSIEA
jgi:quinol monooxygenase YgiN